MANSAISHQVKLRRTTLNNLRPLRREKNNQMSLWETQAESLLQKRPNLDEVLTILRKTLSPLMEEK
jgi:hypothetical protein